MSDQFASEFLDLDFRHNRPLKFGMPMSSELTVQKHQIMLPADRIKNKRVLDIGCFIAQTGHWCLNHGAEHYTGVEINPQFSNTAETLLQKYHSQQSWKIINLSLEDYFDSHSDHYDIIFCWNVIFGHNNHQWFLEQLAARADQIIIASRHPKAMWFNHANEISNDLWHDLEYNIPYVEWQDRQMTQTFAENASVYCTAANSSLAAQKLFMAALGYSSDLDAYEKFKKQFPNDFGLFREPGKVGFFVLDFRRDSQVQRPELLVDMYRDENLQKKNIVGWLT